MVDRFNQVPYVGDSVAAAYGSQFGLQVGPSAQVVAYVRSTGVQDGDRNDISERLVPSIAEAALKARAGRGDVIVVLDGHVETVSAAILATLPSSTVIQGAGTSPKATYAPTFNYTATAGSLSLAAEGIQIRGMRFVMDQVDVVAGVVITAANVTISGCHFLTNGSVGQSVSAITISDVAADNAVIANNSFEGTVSDPATGGTIVLGAVTDGVTICGNTFAAGAVAATGFVSIAAAATGLVIKDNVMFNKTAASTACIAVADAASEGLLVGNQMAVKSASVTPEVEGIVVTGSTNILRYLENYNTTEPDVSGVLSPVAS